jgi:hypothetical protein
MWHQPSFPERVPSTPTSGRTSGSQRGRGSSELCPVGLTVARNILFKEGGVERETTAVRDLGPTLERVHQPG